MNKTRRKEISIICKKLHELKDKVKKSQDVRNELNDISIDINSVFWDESDYMENIPENMQSGYRYEKAEEACENLESAIDSVKEAENCSEMEDVIKCIKDAIDYLNDASM